VFAETLIFNTDNSVFARLLQQLPVAQSDFVTAVGNRVAKQPIFIFVPGILGSKLMDSDGEVIWGKTDVGDLFKTSDKLAYDPDEKVTTNTLADYDIMVTDLDVYGKALSIINDMNMTDVRHLLLFSYDWRKDIRAAARDLQERMTGEWAEALKGRKVIFLAHSMGGLVTTWWYHHYFKNAEIKHTFGGIEQVIFLGTPHSGSPAMLFLMLDRYTANLDPGWISKKFQSRVFGDLNRAAFSLSQYLPNSAPLHEGSPRHQASAPRTGRGVARSLSSEGVAQVRSPEMAARTSRRQQKGILRPYSAVASRWRPFPAAIGRLAGDRRGCLFLR
jgi:pimeloyl-ACP methyl ester carboxylesterase